MMQFKRAGFWFVVLLSGWASTEVLGQEEPKPPTETKPNYGFWSNGNGPDPYILKEPAFIEKGVEYDPATGQYLISEKIGNDFYRAPSTMTFDEYLDVRGKELEREYFEKISGIGSGGSGLADRRDPFARFDLKDNMLDRLFGGNKIEITPKGQVSLFFGVNYNKTDNPILPVRQRLQGGFDFRMGIQVDVTGKIGEKLNLSTSFNNQATFNFDNKVKLNYNSEEFGEDDIIQKIEAGNVSLPLKSNLIQGSQALFGLKTELKFGYLRLTALASQQQSRRKELTIQGGAQLQDFEVKPDQYDENRNFLLSQYNRDNFERALANLPQLNSLFQVTRVQVWVTNDRNETENIRDIVALADLGEYDRFNNPNGQQLYGATGPRNPDIAGLELPSNDANDLYAKLLANPMARRLETSVSTLISSEFQMEQARDFEKVTARLLSQNEFTLDENMAKLGIIQINTNLKPQDVLGIAIEFTYNGRHYSVGEFADDIPYDQQKPNVLYVKMLKSITQRTDVPLWDLMMKNVYNIGAYNVSREDFRLDIFYEDPGQGIKRFLPTSNVSGVPLIRLFGMDRLNVQGDPQADGIFDFVPGITIFPNTGRIMFPTLEPFGSTIANKIDDPVLADFYSFPDLYDTILVRAREVLDKNRFIIKGSYKTSVTSRISLGAFNLPRGSLRVTAGGTVLRENEDYLVDYNVGQITILNDAYLKAATPIKVSFEDNTLFGFQTRTMIGLRADYERSENFTIGATFLQLFERPPTFKVNIGDDPINNKVYGLDFSFNKEVPWLTRAIDKLPLLSTKEPSSIQMTAEGALLQPGHARAINEGGDREGVVYIDDFEGSTANIPIHIPSTQWVIASVPQDAGNKSIERFPESKLINDIAGGANRALLNWYQIDPGVRTGNARDDIYQSYVDRTEVFPNQQVQVGTNTELRTLDLRYYPDVRGPYNFDLPAPEGTANTAGILSNGLLANPATRWGGIMRDLTTTDWEQANIGYVEMWLLSPFHENEGSDGKLVLNIGNISEDILRDGRKAFEQGLPTDQNRTTVDNTAWGRVPANRQINTALDPNPEGQRQQDLGLDGLDNDGEREAFADVLEVYRNFFTDPAIMAAIEADPSNDDYVAYRDNRFGNEANIFNRYIGFNGMQGNSAQPPTNDGFTTASRFLPDMEDINRDGTMNESEAYFEYDIELKNDGQGGIQFNQYIIESLDGANGRKWYRLKIPVDQFTKRVNNIPDFRSMRFIRLYLTEFERPVTLRFAEISIVRNQWRIYERIQSAIQEPTFNTTLFDINARNIERNSKSRPFGYHLPPGIERENNIGPFPNLLQNEQSMSMDFCNLKQSVGDFIGIYKLLQMDFRVYDKMRMFVHLEEGYIPGQDEEIQDQIEDGAMSIFVRFGSDFEANYYEYEIPLTVSKTNGAPLYDDPDYRRYIWPLANEIDIDLKFLKDIKLRRNGQNLPLQDVYEEEIIKMIGDDSYVHKFRVKGNPNIGLVRGVLIGVKNNGSKPTCGAVWVNELRLTGLDNRGGYATTARMQAKLADLGRIDISANYSSIGYGGLDQRVQERARQSDLSYDIAGSFALNKFLPDTWGLSIPFYAQYSKSISRPEFDPYDLDIPLKEKLESIGEPAIRDSVEAAAVTVTEIRSYNFTNVRKNRVGGGGGKPMPWHISNFSVTYAWSETVKQDPIIANDILETHNGGLNYNYAPGLKPIEPFKKIVKSDKYLGFIKNLNFNPLPNNFTFNTVMDRRLGVTSYRFAGDDPFYSTFYNKQWAWDRNYALQWDLTKSLQFNFNAINRAVIDELPEFDQETEVRTPDEDKKAEVWRNIQNLGRTKDYSHNYTLNWTVPMKNFPFMEWVTLRAQLDGIYNFNTAALNVDSLGNVIRNGHTRRINGDFNFENLYSQWKYLDQIQGKKGRGNARPARTTGSQTIGAPKDKDAKDPKAGEAEEEKKKKREGPTKFEKIAIRPLLSLRRARIDYQEQYTNTVPGYTPPSRLMGMNQFDSPGWGFISGLTAPTTPWLDNAAANNWMSDNVWINQNVERTKQQSLRGTFTLEPVDQFRIDVDMQRTYNESYFELFKVREPGDPFTHSPISNIGSYNISFMSMKTIFRNDDGALQLFEDFQANRQIISSRMGEGMHPEDVGYTEGYGKRQLAVMVSSFIATYTGQDPNTAPLFDQLFNYIPRPNWKLTYDGLAKLPGMKDIFSSFRISHGYKSTLTVSSFQSDFLDYDINNPGRLNPETQNFYSEFIIPDVVIMEAFAPLIGIDLRTKNGMGMGITYNKSRNLQLLINDPQVPETKATDISFNFSYIFKNVKLPFLYIGVPKKARKNLEGQELTFQLNTTFRDDIQLNHQLDTQEPVSIPARGNRAIRINPTLDYPLNKRIRLQLRYEYTQNKPKTFNGFKTTTNVGGINVIFTLD